MAVIDFAAYTRRAKGRVSAVDGADRRDGTALDTSFEASLHMGRRGSVDGARSVEACPAVAAFGRVCRANDTWCGHVPGESGDGRAVRELDDAYNAFFNSEARTMKVFGSSSKFSLPSRVSRRMRASTKDPVR